MKKFLKYLVTMVCMPIVMAYSQTNIQTAKLTIFSNDVRIAGILYSGTNNVMIASNGVLFGISTNSLFANYATMAGTASNLVGILTVNIATNGQGLSLFVNDMGYLTNANAFATAAQGLNADWASNSVVTINGLTQTWNLASVIATWASNKAVSAYDLATWGSNGVITLNGLTSGWNQASADAAAVSNSWYSSVAYLILSADTTRWNNAYNYAVATSNDWYGSVARLITSGDTNRWNAAGLTATWASNGVISLNGLTSGWNQANVDASWASNKAISAYDIAIWSSNGVIAVNGSTSTWNQAALNAVWASNGVVTLNGLTSGWNNILVDATWASNGVVTLNGLTSGWNQASANATWASNGVVTLNGLTSGWNQVAMNALTNGSSNVVLTGNVVINGNDTSAGDEFRPQYNGLQVLGTTNMDTYIGLAGKSNRPAWFMQTYRNEGTSDPLNPEFLYFSNEQLHKDIFMLSEGGRMSINKASNLMDYHSSFLGSIATGLNDCDFIGIFTYSKQRKYWVTICDIAGGTDKWTWSKSLNNGLTWIAQPVTNDCAITNMILEGGVGIVFGNTTGHQLTDAWMRTGFSQLPLGTAHIAPPAYQEVGTTTNYNNCLNWRDISYEMSVISTNAPRQALTYATSAIYCGRTIKMNSVWFELVQPAIGVTLTFEYWDGSTWATIPAFIDGTANLTVSGQVSWDKSLMPNWQTNGIPNHGSDYDMYWYRVRSTTVPSTVPTFATITPQGKVRLGVMAHHYDDDFSFYIDGDGASWQKKAYMTDTNSAFQANQLITEARANTLIKSAQGTIYYPITNFSLGSTNYSLATAPQSTQFIFTNTTSTAGGGTNYGRIFAITNSTIGTTSLVAGTRYTLQNMIANAGNASFEQFQLVEFNTGVTNVLATSANSLQLINGIGTLNSINLTITLPTNVTVSSSNYLGYRPLLIAGQNGSWRQYYGAQNNSYFVQGSTVQAPSAAGVSSIIAGTGISVSPITGLGNVTVNVSGNMGGITVSNVNQLIVTNLGYSTINGITNFTSGIIFLNTTGYTYNAWVTNANGATRTNICPLQ